MMRGFRLLLRLYPARFRRRFAGELEDTFSEISREPRYRGLAGRVRLWTDVAADIAHSASRQRARQYLARHHPHSPDPEKRSEMDTVLQDIWYALRQFARRPGFAAVTVLTLGLAIGGNSLMYGLVDGFVLHPFPYPDPDRLVAVGVAFPKMSAETSYVEVLSPAEYSDIKTSQSFAATASFDLGNRNISGGDVPERVFTALLLDDLFPVIGMPPQLGRGFTRDELTAGGPAVAIISNRLWHSRFGADPGIVNRTIRIGGQSTTVVGVMPPGLILIGTDLWMPWRVDPSKVPRNVRQLNVLARLRPGVSLRQANAELGTIASRVEQSHKASFQEYEGWRLTAAPWANALFKDIRPAAFLLLGAVSFVLLIACANLTNLFLARSTTRQRELAVRLALGAARWRIARHLLTETVLLAIAGAALGVVIAQVGLGPADALIPRQLQMLDIHATVNTRVLLWSLAMAVGTGLVVGVLPAIQATRTDPQESLKSDGRVGAGPRGSKLRSVLVVAEVALSVVLLLGAGLLMRTFVNIQRVEPGFEPRGVLTMRLTLPRERYPDEAANAFFDSLVERLRADSRVRGVSAASQFPPFSMLDTQFTLERPGSETAGIPTALITVVTPTHFETLRSPMHAGRLFTAADNLAALPVAIVNQTFVNRFMGGSAPIGQRMMIGSPQRPRPWTTIVGVVTDFRNRSMTQSTRPEIYTPMRQQTAWNQLFVLVRGDGEASALLPTVRDAIRTLDPEQPFYNVVTLEEAVAQSSFQQRLAALLLSVFAGVALVLAAVGIFGVLSYMVSTRTQEIGVRLAVGAAPRQVMWMVLRHVLRLTVSGVLIGTAVLLAAGKAIEGLLFGVRTTDPATLLAAIGALGAVALLAAWFPTLRATRVDPVRALRSE